MAMTLLWLFLPNRAEIGRKKKDPADKTLSLMEFPLSNRSVAWGACALSHVSFLTPWTRQQPARLLCPWDFPGKNSGVGCHSLLHIRMWMAGLHGSRITKAEARKWFDQIIRQSRWRHPFSISLFHLNAEESIIQYSFPSTYLLLAQSKNTEVRFEPRKR